jgi:dipeptidyl aminopeptidase/acylaminoacyl peptidase
MTDELRDRLSRFADGVGPVGPDLDGIVRLGKRRHARRVGVGAVIAVVVAAAIAAPLYALSGLGHDEMVPAASPGDVVFSTPKWSHQDGQIFSMALDGTHLQQLTPEDANYLSVNVSADGTQMAYVRYEERPDHSSREGIYVANVDGTDAHEILETSDPSTISVRQLAWSPDGSAIGFIKASVSLDAGSEASRLWVMGADGSDPRVLADANITSFSWSPDGSRIAYAQETVTQATTTTGVVLDDIYVMNADGSDAHQITYETGLSRDPLWSPDGEQIAFAHYQNGQPRPMVVNTDGGDLHLLAPDLAPLSWPLAWSPDARAVLVRQITSDACVLYSVGVDGTTTELLRSAVHATFGPAPGTPPYESAACADAASWLGATSSPAR